MYPDYNSFPVVQNYNTIFCNISDRNWYQIKVIICSLPFFRIFRLNITNIMSLSISIIGYLTLMLNYCKNFIIWFWSWIIPTVKRIKNKKKKKIQIANLKRISSVDWILLATIMFPSSPWIDLLKWTMMNSVSAMDFRIALFSAWDFEKELFNKLA